MKDKELTHHGCIGDPMKDKELTHRGCIGDPMGDKELTHHGCIGDPMKDKEGTHHGCIGDPMKDKDLTHHGFQSQLYDPLYKELKSRDTKNTIPVSSKGDTLNVTISLTVLKISSLSLRTGDAELDTWIYYEWFDNRLTWEPSEYGDISAIRLPPSDIWRPDIVPYRGHADVTDAPVVLFNSGLVYYTPPTTTKTRCDVSKYSSDDTVNCSVKIGSWTYSGNIMDVQNKTSEIDVSEYYHDDQ
ncbi:acetylcholine receptor subunit alpha-L1-like [Haliotis rubra]|uniref:acetylcholine receptor subunit alpha-L1-like n=1 Tax=Haliotis rubra TaxID=36100 RepID=UPI001EE5D62F|nr:acetylcholine receptor subunit alpha-L1-like [Haliotis rubra]